MQLTEKEIEDYIFEDLSLNKGYAVNLRGLVLPSSESFNNVSWHRQLNIDPYGIIDIVGFYRQRGTIHVDLIELKAVPLDSHDINQIFMYKTGLEVYLGNTFKGCRIEFHCFLIGPEIKSGHYLHNNCLLTIIEYQYGLNGMRFDSHRGEWHKPDGKQKSFRTHSRRLNGKAIH